ncbi:MAG: cupin domain-containing protein [Sulfuricaulis sp.]|nr:cupin domain-containing protein [Sulfuricaulis sp.]
MAGPIRRVVTGHDRNGKAVVISDGPPAAGKTNPLRPGHVSTDLWRTRVMPVPIPSEEPDATVPRPLNNFPSPNGTVVRISEIPPDSDAVRNLDPGKSREIFRSYGNENASTFGRGGRHPLMHRTESVDYVVVLDGEITMILDEVDVPLKTGDVVIQRGTNHAWSNRSGKPCRMLYVLIDGEFDLELAALLETGPDP